MERSVGGRQAAHLQGTIGVHAFHQSYRILGRAFGESLRQVSEIIPLPPSGLLPKRFERYRRKPIVVIFFLYLDYTAVTRISADREARPLEHCKT
jgi:hypothetical protein